jgi:SAM-dependent methyltransferase
MISDALLESVQCPDCGGRVARQGVEIRCDGCGRVFDGARGYLDLRPRETFQENTKYLDEALHVDARHETIAPPVLGSRIRNNMLRRFLELTPADHAVDLGCGSGRALAWNAGSGARLTGIDIAPYFAAEALERSDLVLGDLRRLPLRDGAFGKAWSLDVLEHLSRPALVGMLREANRVLAPGGALFVYTHVRRNGPIARGLRGVNRIASWCERAGLIDLRQERLRKSDHLNPIADHDDLERIAIECGFTIERLTYYTPIIGAFVENVLVRIAERAMQRRQAKKIGSGSADPAAVRAARLQGKSQVARGGATYWALRGVSSIMALDVALFGRFQSGPFFALLRKSGDPIGPPGDR